MTGVGVLIIIMIIAVALITVYYYSYFGFCIFEICDDEIKILSAEFPESVPERQEFPIKFTIANLGNVEANNCVLHVSSGVSVIGTLSESFSIEPEKKLNIDLVYPGLDLGNALRLFESEKETSITAWTVCDNAESQRSHFKIVLDVAFPIEQINDAFTSEKP